MDSTGTLRLGGTANFESKIYTSSGLNSSIMGESGGNGRFTRVGEMKELVENVELKRN